MSDMLTDSSHFVIPPYSRNKPPQVHRTLPVRRTHWTRLLILPALHLPPDFPNSHLWNRLLQTSHWLFNSIQNRRCAHLQQWLHPLLILLLLILLLLLLLLLPILILQLLLLPLLLLLLLLLLALWCLWTLLIHQNVLRPQHGGCSLCMAHSLHLEIESAQRQMSQWILYSNTK